MFSPDRIFDAHAYVGRPILVDGVTPVASHQEPAGLPVSIASASAMAPAALISPVPWLKASVFERGIALNSTIAFIRFGVIAFCRWNPFWLCACSTSATTPVETAALMLVPFRISRRPPLLIFPDASAVL